jgi:hypothetical protein
MISNGETILIALGTGLLGAVAAAAIAARVTLQTARDDHREQREAYLARGQT